MYFKDGTSYTNSTYLLGHELDLDEAETDVREKYNEIMNPRVGEERAVRIYQSLMELEKLETAEILSGLL